MSTEHEDDDLDVETAALAAADLEGSDDEDGHESGGDDGDDVSLGFAVERADEPGALLRNQLPSKLGGRPAWLDPAQLPLSSELLCALSGRPLDFLLQVYAPINEDPRAFHRAIFLFISPAGTGLGSDGAVRAFRCQLPRTNPYYPYEAPEPTDRPAPLSTAAAAMAAARCARFADNAADAAAASGLENPPGFPEYELVVEAEPSGDEAVPVDPQVERLLSAYREKEREAGGAAAEPEVDADTSAFGAPNEEVADFSSFTARIGRAPEQCLRYTYADDAQPLWASRQRRPSSIPTCERCGARRRFEFQVMPQCLSFMGIDSLDQHAPDWATIAVYTCSASCAPTPKLSIRATAEATDVDAAEGVWQVIDPASEEAAEARAMVGRQAMLHGLQAKPELNGAACTILGWQHSSGRWGVESHEEGKPRLSVRSANLRLRMDAAEQMGRDGGYDGGYAEEYVWLQTN